jgi:hypothetical protein
VRKDGLGYSLGDFFAVSSGHPDQAWLIGREKASYYFSCDLNFVLAVERWLHLGSRDRWTLRPSWWPPGRPRPSWPSWKKVEKIKFLKHKCRNFEIMSHFLIRFDNFQCCGIF